MPGEIRCSRRYLAGVSIGAQLVRPDATQS
jgi:hypothetical protein